MVSKPHAPHPISCFETIDDEDGSLIMGTPHMKPIIFSSGTGAQNKALMAFFDSWPAFLCRFVKLSDRSFGAFVVSAELRREREGDNFGEGKEASTRKRKRGERKKREENERKRSACMKTERKRRTRVSVSLLYPLSLLLFL